MLGRDSLSPGRVGTVSLMDFICMCPSLIPDLPALLGEKIVCKDHMDIVESEVIRLSNILKFLNKGGGIGRIGPQCCLYLR